MGFERDFKIQIEKDSIKFLQKQVRDIQNKIFEKVEEIKKNPYIGLHLEGFPKNWFRERVGKIRIVYIVELEKSLIIIHTIDYRGQVYKHL